jgi:hypothetical protein
MIVLVFFLLLVTGCDMQTIEPEIHLIPKGFVGQIVLYFDSPDNALQKRENQARVYEIPPNGRLHTAFPPNPGIRPPNSTQFYYVDLKGERTPIPLRTDRGLSPQAIVVSNIYVMNKEVHYFVDHLDRIDTYNNPALDNSERQWD